MKFPVPPEFPRLTSCTSPGPLQTVLMTAAVMVFLLGTCGGCRVWHRTRVSSAETIASRQYVQQAVESIEQKEMGNASSQLALAVKTNPENLEARTMYADTLWNQGECDEAIRQMEKAVRHPEVTPELVVKLAEMYFERENYSLAQRYVSLGLRHNSGMPDAWVLQGKIHEIQNHPEQALAAYHQAAFYAPEDVKIQTLLAQQYLKNGKPQRALEAAQAAQEKSTTDTPPVEVLLCKGEALSQLQRNGEAVQVLAQANTLQPENPQILTALASAQFQNQEYSSALQNAARGLKLEPENAQCSAILHEIQSVAAARTGGNTVVSALSDTSGTPAGTPTTSPNTSLAASAEAPIPRSDVSPAAAPPAASPVASPVPAQVGTRYGAGVRMLPRR